MPRKKKPGPKPQTGRPPTARRREYERQRAATEREKLRDAGYEIFVMIAPQDQAPSLKRASRINRLDGLLSAADASGDSDAYETLTHRKQLAQLEQQQEIRAENEARNRRERELKQALAKRQEAQQQPYQPFPKPIWSF